MGESIPVIFHKLLKLWTGASYPTTLCSQKIEGRSRVRPSQHALQLDFCFLTIVRAYLLSQSLVNEFVKKNRQYNNARKSNQWQCGACRKWGRALANANSRPAFSKICTKIQLTIAIDNRAQPRGDNLPHIKIPILFNYLSNLSRYYLWVDSDLNQTHIHCL